MRLDTLINIVFAVSVIGVYKAAAEDKSTSAASMTATLNRPAASITAVPSISNNNILHPLTRTICHYWATFAFKQTWNPLARMVTGKYAGLGGEESTFFRADKDYFFVLRDELPLTSFDPPFVDWIAFDLQTGEQVILRTRNKYELNGDDITHEATCNKVMGELVKGNFKSNTYFGSNWIVLKYNDAPTVQELLGRGRENLTHDHLMMPAAMYENAAKQLNKLHQHSLYHGNLRLSDFKVDEATGSITLINFMFCGPAKSGSVYRLLLSKEKKKQLALFAPYMTSEEIEKKKQLALFAPYMTSEEIEKKKQLALFAPYMTSEEIEKKKLLALFAPYMTSEEIKSLKHLSE